MNNVTVRAATLNDLQILFDFEQGIIEAERPFDSTLKEGKINYYDLAAYIASPDVEVAVAVLDDEIVGSGYALVKEAKAYQKYSRYAYLGFMYVKPEHRGKGINRQIIHALKQWAFSKGLTEMRLEVYNDNIPAIKAYKKFGFTPNLLEMRIGLNDD